MTTRSARPRIKIHHVALRADEFLAAVTGEMTPTELGVYWMICLLHYSRRGPIPYDLKWLRAKFSPERGNWVIAPIVKSLIKKGRVYQDGDRIGVGRCRDELEIALRYASVMSRIGTGGGRPSNKNKDIRKGYGFRDENLTRARTITRTREGASAPSLRHPKAAGRGSRLPQGFVVPPEWIAEGHDVRARDGLASVDIAAEARKFTDYWTSKAGRDGVRTDWRAVWRNWVRNAREQGHGRIDPDTRFANGSDTIVEAVLDLERHRRTRH